MDTRERIIIRICKSENKNEMDAVILGLTMSLALPHSKVEDLIDLIEERAKNGSANGNERLKRN